MAAALDRSQRFGRNAELEWGFARLAAQVASQFCCLPACQPGLRRIEILNCASRILQC